jgi:hypothetical protein
MAIPTSTESGEAQGGLPYDGFGRARVEMHHDGTGEAGSPDEHPAAR